MKINDQRFLRDQQYRDASNLDARAALHRQFSTNPQGWFTWLFEQAAFQPGERILEVGGGPGYLWRRYLPHLPQGCRIFFSDFSPGMVNEARRAIPPAPGGACFSVLDAQSIPFPDASFDRVVANHMLYHIPDRPRAIAELWRVLRPGGILLAATNGFNHLRELHRFVWIAFDRPANEPGAERSAFNLENGAEQLGASFGKVELRRYPDELRVTQVQPILDYLLSMWEWESHGEARDDPRLDGLRLTLEEQIRRDGAVHISKDTGLFVAQK